MTGLLLSSLLLARREIVRFLREPSRVVGALATPFVFWLLLGGGFSATFRAGGDSDYATYFFPGVLALTVFFTAIFSTISVIEDRKAGFLQAVLASPVPRGAVIGGKVLGGGILAAAQGMLLLGILAAAGMPVSLLGAALAGGALFLVAVPLVLLGLVLAFRFDSTQGFHAVMNLFLMPAWILSGSVFPLAGAPRWIAVVAVLNPLTYAVAILRRTLDPGAALLDPTLPTLPVSFALLAVSCGIFAALARRAMMRE